LKQSGKRSSKQAEHKKPPTSSGSEWQATMSTIRERNAVMFNNKKLHDVKFVVGSSGKNVSCIFKTQQHTNKIIRIQR